MNQRSSVPPDPIAAAPAPADDPLRRSGSGLRASQPVGGSAAEVPLLCHRCGYQPAQPGETQCPRDGLWLVPEPEHRKAPRDAFLGTVIGGKFPILGVIGAGGMGAVYRSIQPLVQREVAIKVILPTTTFSQDEAHKRFLREAQTIAALSHPSVVTLFEFGVESDGTLYMVMEYVRGRTLYSLLRSRSLTCSQLLRIVLQVLEALEVAHAQGIVHRDIKPENIMILEEARRTGSGPRVKVLDFGLAKMLGPSEVSRVTRTGSIAGSPFYMSPEQATGSAALDGRTDVYSLAAVLYEGLAGRPPFLADNQMQLVAMRVVLDPPPLPRAAHIPAGLPAILRKAMARDPAERYQADELADALRRLPLGPDQDQLLPPIDLSGGTASPATPAGTGQPLLEQALAQVARVDSGPSMPVEPATLPETPALPGPAGVGLKMVLGLVAAGLLALGSGFGLMVWLQAEDRLGQTAEGTAQVAFDSGLSQAIRPPVLADVGPPTPPTTLVRLDSQPQGAQVTGPDGIVLGQTPLEVRSTGAHGDRVTYRLTRPGYQDRPFELVLDGREQDRVIQLQRIRKRPPEASAGGAKGTPGVIKGAGGTSGVKDAPTGKPKREL